MSKKNQGRPEFHRLLRMDIESFYVLLSFIHDSIQVDEAHGASRGGMIIPELCLYCTLRYLAGASYLDVSVFAGISTASFYRIVHKTIHAINLTDELTVLWLCSLLSFFVLCRSAGCCCVVVVLVVLLWLFLWLCRFVVVVVVVFVVVVLLLWLLLFCGCVRCCSSSCCVVVLVVVVLWLCCCGCGCSCGCVVLWLLLC